MSMYSSRFIQDIAEHLMVINNDPPDVQFVSGGYLILASEQGVDVMRENFEAQRRQGAEVELLEPSQLKAKFPYMNTDGVALGSLGVCVCVWMCVCVCGCGCGYVCVDVCVCVWMWVWVCVCGCVCVCGMCVCYFSVLFPTLH